MNRSTLLRVFLILDLILYIPVNAQVDKSQLPQILGTLNIKQQDVVVTLDKTVNAKTDGKTIYIHEGLLNHPEITEDSLKSILLHENAHRTLKHPQKHKTLREMLNKVYIFISPVSEMGAAIDSILKLVEINLIRNNEWEADELAYKKAYELGLPETVCDVPLKLLGNDSHTDDLTEISRTHPLNYKRANKCHEIYKQLRGETKDA